MVAEEIFTIDDLKTMSNLLYKKGWGQRSVKEERLYEKINSYLKGVDPKFETNEEWNQRN